MLVLSLFIFVRGGCFVLKLSVSICLRNELGFLLLSSLTIFVLYLEHFLSFNGLVAQNPEFILCPI